MKEEPRMEKRVEVITPEKFLEQIAERKPDLAYCRVVVGSFDEASYTIFFEDDERKWQTSFRSSVHSMPEVPPPLMKMIEQASIQEGATARSLRTIHNPVFFVQTKS